MMVHEKDFEDIIAKYPELIEDGLTLLGRQVTLYGRRMDLLFMDKFKRKLIVELKIGPVKDAHIGQVLSYEGMLLSAEDPTIRVMLIGNRVPPNIQRSLDHHGIAWREITIKQLREFLMERDDNLHNAISDPDLTKTENPNPSKAGKRRTKTLEEHLKDSSSPLIELFQAINERIMGLSPKIIRYTTWDNILYKTSVIFVELNVQKQRLRLLLRTRDSRIDDPKLLTQIVPKSHGWGNLTHNLYIDPRELDIKFSMEDIMKLVDQSFRTTY